MFKHEGRERKRLADVMLSHSVEDYEIVVAICVVVSPFGVAIFISHADHRDTLKM